MKKMGLPAVYALWGMWMSSNWMWNRNNKLRLGSALDLICKWCCLCSERRCYARPWPRGQFWLSSIDPIQLLASFTVPTVWQIVESIGPNLLRIFTGILDKITQFLRKSVEEIPSFSLLRRQKMQNILLIRGQRLVCLKLILNTVVVNFELCLAIICKSSPMQFCRLELKRTLLTTYCCAPIRVSQTVIHATHRKFVDTRTLLASHFCAKRVRKKLWSCPSHRPVTYGTPIEVKERICKFSLRTSTVSQNGFRHVYMSWAI